MPDRTALDEKFRIASASRGVDVRGYAAAIGGEFATEADVFRHYLTAGRSARPELFPFLDPAYYAQQLDAPLPEQVSVFEHYMTEGSRRGLSPTPLYDPSFVRKQAPDSSWETLFHYLGDPAAANIDPHPFFSRRYYLAANPDVASAGADPLQHFVRHGWRERRPIHPFFRTEDYARFGLPAGGSVSDFNARLVAALASPRLAEGQLMFDAAHYSRSLGADCIVERPLQHFVCGFDETGGSGFPLFDAAFFLSQSPVVRRGLNPYVEYLSDFSHQADPHPYFDRTFYRPSVAADSNVKSSLLEHFVRIGAANGAQPSAKVVTIGARPHHGSGWQAVVSFPGTSGREFWLWCPDVEALQSHMFAASEIEPAISTRLLNSFVLHEHNRPINRHGSLLISTVTKIARCNCLVVSDACVGDGLAATLHLPSTGLTSSTRPWLTLLACSEPMLRYSHPLHSASVAISAGLDGGADDRARFVAEVVLAALPNRLVLVVDSLGIALLRDYGASLLAVVPSVSLVLEPAQIEPTDEQWFDEYLQVNVCDFDMVATRGKRFADLPALCGIDRANLPRVVSL